MKKILALLLPLVAAMMLQSASALSPADQKIADRIQPVAKVCVSGEDCAAAQVVAAPAAASGPRGGEEVYNAACMACHNTGAAGAPMKGDVAAWSPRIDKGMETLVSHAIGGFGAMPAKGGCAACSDDEIANAVEYLVSQAQ